MELSTSPSVNYLKDYRSPDFKIETVTLKVELYEDKAIVHASLLMHRHVVQGQHARALELDGEELTLRHIAINDTTLSPNQYELKNNQLIIPNVPDTFTLTTITEIYPQKNTALSGLYRSENMFCTQCEAQGFRRITYYLDRPDVMATFTTTIVADKTHYPILLSNGNRMESGELSDNRHWVTWHDPFAKPSYLFALVAGNLAKITDYYTTRSGRQVALEIYVDHENRQKCDQALQSLRHAMEWDEKQYGREYDLDVYMIVAVNDFNMGAMENKGLNIFNAKYVLADQKSATDFDFQAVELVIGHEYFHNWTGNRITCRDWFQLSLKEGLTVFREQQFSAAMGSPAVKRIQDVKYIRTRQFAEDAGPMAHPVRPDSYIEINNFYTSTVYNKGAEVIRMLHTLLGEKQFRKGMDCYFERHDGHAVTIEDFVASFEDANNRDLKQFYRWYQQAGTPEIQANGDFNPKTHTFTLRLKQSCPDTPGQKNKKPFLIPIKMSLYNQSGQLLPLKTKHAILSTEQGHYLVLDKEEEEYVFEDLSEQPIPSLLGNFSAPVKLDYLYSIHDLITLMKHDIDLFNRWDSAQKINLKVIDKLMQAYEGKLALDVPEEYLSAIGYLLDHDIKDPALLAQQLTIPSFQYITETKPAVSVDAIIAARGAILDQISTQLSQPLLALYQHCQQKDDGTLSGESMGFRALKNVCLYYLTRSGNKIGKQLALEQYRHQRNMTDTMGALAAINTISDPLRNELMEDFYGQWKHSPLVVNKWLSLHATYEQPDALSKMKSLLHHEAFDLGNPNKVYALINTFGASNPVAFHSAHGEGYRFLADRVVELNLRNPQVASRVLENLTHWQRLTSPHREQMKEALVHIKHSGKLSEDVFEVVTKSLMEKA